MKTIILCGGMGTRLREETEFKPKPMAQIGGMPILRHIMKIYSRYGFNDFVLALGYKSDVIKDYFIKSKYYASDFSFSNKDGKIMDFLSGNGEETEDFNIVFAETGLETPHGERILKLKPYISEDCFMVTYGDGVSDIDISKLVEFHKSHGKIATITGVHPVSKWGLVNVDENNLITNFAQKPALYDYVNGGFMVLNKEFFDYLKPGDMVEDGLRRLIPKKQLVSYKHEGFWYGMDTYADFLHLNKLWESEAPWAVWQKEKKYPAPQKLAFSPLIQKTVLVTGGAGFIGSNLVKELSRQGKRVVVIDDLSSGKKEYLPREAVFYQADVRGKNIAEIFEKEQPSLVFHLAARPLVDNAYDNPSDVIETNIMGTVNVLEACRRQKNIESIVVASSDKAYGKSQQLPYVEHHPLRGDHPYDVSKSSADLIAQTYAKTYNLPVLIARFSNVFGPGDFNLSRIIPGIMESILRKEELLIRSDGAMVREYTYVKDIVAGCIRLADYKKDFGEAFNFGSKHVLTVVDVVKKLEETLETKVSYKILNSARNEIPAQYLDWSKARQLLGWQPETSLEEGIRETFEWFKANRFIS